MKKYTSMLLDVWREACRHIEITQCTSLIAPLLAEHLPADLVLVRRIDLHRGCIETVATGACHAPRAHDSSRRRPARPSNPVPARDDLRADHLEQLLTWCRRGRVATSRARMPESKLFLPDGAVRDFLAGPLADGDGPIGVLILISSRHGAFKPPHEPILRALLEPFSVALENDRRLREMTALREAAEADKRSLLTRLGRQDISDTIVGIDAGLRHVMQRVDQVAGSDVAVLILGETGSGKEVIARAIHTRSRFASGPFLRVNCGAIPPELIDSELFGHERGSFTGAVGQRKGWFERADGGTLFLDEVGELPPAAQVRLLRILQDGTFERVGGQQTQKVDVRIVAATHRNLQAMVADGRFREDLWYRVAVFPIHLPPLRDRPEDLPALATHFALRASRRFGTPPLVPSPQDMDLLLSYSWPGNVRELTAVIDRATILGNGRQLDVATALGSVPPGSHAAPSRVEDSPGRAVPSPVASHLEPTRTVRTEPSRAVPSPFASHLEPTRTVPSPADPPAPLSLSAAMATHIERALQQTAGRIEGPHGAAKLLNINPHTLRARMRKLGIVWSRFRPQPSQTDQ